MERATVKNWLSEHMIELVYAAFLAIGNLASYARLKSTHGKRLDKVEEDLEKHADAGEMHRNPDFECRLDMIDDTLKEIKGMLHQALQRRR
jgi:hypothetical protein